jgi:hypothetical protein
MEHKFRKKPVVIEAWEVTDITLTGASRLHLSYSLPMWNVGFVNGKCGIIIPTLEGNHLAEIGDWIIKGVKGEFYPCKPDIFAQTYEPASTPDSPAEIASLARQRDALRETNGELLKTLKHIRLIVSPHIVGYVECELLDAVIAKTAATE